MSSTPLLVYRPECVDSSHPTLNQPPSSEKARHGGLTCGVKDAEPIIRGHVNWLVVSQTGRLRWGGFAGGVGDHDFDLFMEAPHLVTRGNVIANRRERSIKQDPQRDSLIELEFSGVETVGLFSTEYGGELWSPLLALRQVSTGSPEYGWQNRRADSLFRNRPAVVTGLLGLDGEHDFHTELHPVLALAADVSHEMRDRDDHAWLVFIRNMGNEGECSDGQVPWVSRDSTRYVLEIPWKAGADLVQVEIDKSPFGFIARRPTTLRVEVDSLRAVRLAADLPLPTQMDSIGIVYGTLRLRWLENGVPIPHDSGATIPGDLIPESRRERGYEPVNVNGFPLTQRLCITVARAQEAHRDHPQSIPPQTMLPDAQTKASVVAYGAVCTGMK
jgi:hypothetical protein